MFVEMNCNSPEHISSYMMVLCGQTLLHKGIIANSVETDQSKKTTNLLQCNLQIVYFV